MQNKYDKYCCINLFITLLSQMLIVIDFCNRKITEDVLCDIWHLIYSNA